MWFVEKSADIGTGFKIKQKLFSKRSRFQKIEVYKTAGYGNMLVLDGLIQTVEGLNFFYHEFLVHPAMQSVKNPERVLVIGGGDGGVAHEVLKYRSVKEVVIREVDKDVVEVAKRYLKKVNRGAFKDKRLKLEIGDGVSFTSNHKFDVVIVDISDPVGPSSKLYSPRFFERLKSVMKKRGVLSAQTESPLVMPQTFKKLRKIISQTFPYFTTIVSMEPSYPGGFWTYTLGSNIPIRRRNKEKVPTRVFDFDELVYLFKVFRRLVK